MTAPVFQAAMGWLHIVASTNMAAMFVTTEVSHLEITWLRSKLPRKQFTHAHHGRGVPPRHVRSTSGFTVREKILARAAVFSGGVHGEAVGNRQLQSVGVSERRRKRTTVDSNNSRRVYRVAQGKEGCRIAAIFNDLQFAVAAQASELVKAGQIPARDNVNGQAVPETRVA